MGGLIHALLVIAIVVILIRVVRGRRIQKHHTRAADRGPSLHPSPKQIRMNWDRIQGNCKQITGKVKAQRDKLTDDDPDVVAGRRDQLTGKIQERYGVAKEDAEKQLAEWEHKAGDAWFKKD